MEEDNNNKSKRLGSITADQKKEILEFMESHPELRSGKFSKQFTFKMAQKLWIELSEKLNAFPGAQKEWKQWRKTWQDLKTGAKKKNTQIKNFRKGTGGGPELDIKLTDEEEKIIDIVGSIAVEGDNLVQESTCIFFDHDYLNEIVISQNLTSDSEIATPSVPSKDSAPPKCQNSTYDLEIPCSSTENINRKENVSFKNKCEYQSGNKKKIARVQRLNNALEANDKLIKLTESRNNEKSKYLNMKLKLYEREVVAREKSANFLEKLYLHLIERSSVRAEETYI